MMRPPAPPLRTCTATSSASGSTVTFRPIMTMMSGGEEKKQIHVHMASQASQMAGAPPPPGQFAGPINLSARPPPPGILCKATNCGTLPLPQPSSHSQFHAMSPISEARSTPSTTTSPSSREMRDHHEQQQQQQHHQQQVGYNSGCHQCVAERAAAVNHTEVTVAHSSSIGPPPLGAAGASSVPLGGRQPSRSGTLERDGGGGGRVPVASNNGPGGGGGLGFSETVLEDVFQNVEETRLGAARAASCEIVPTVGSLNSNLLHFLPSPCTAGLPRSRAKGEHVQDLRHLTK
jgi:hypothetical protein